MLRVLPILHLSGAPPILSVTISVISVRSTLWSVRQYYSTLLDITDREVWVALNFCQIKKEKKKEGNASDAERHAQLGGLKRSLWMNGVMPWCLSPPRCTWAGSPNRETSLLVRERSSFYLLIEHFLMISKADSSCIAVEKKSCETHCFLWRSLSNRWDPRNDNLKKLQYSTNLRFVGNKALLGKLWRAEAIFKRDSVYWLYCPI